MPHTKLINFASLWENNWIRELVFEHIRRFGFREVKVNKGLRIHPRHIPVTNMRKLGVCLSNFCGTRRIAVNTFDGIVKMSSHVYLEQLIK